MKIGIGGAEEDNEVGALKEALRKAHNEVGALKEALKKAHLLVKELRKMGTINTAEKEALWDAEDDVRQLTKTISIKEGRNANKEARLKKTEARLRKVNAKSDAESRSQAEELQKLEASLHPKKMVKFGYEQDGDTYLSVDLWKAEEDARRLAEALRYEQARRQTEAAQKAEVLQLALWKAEALQKKELRKAEKEALRKAEKKALRSGKGTRIGT